MKNVRGTALLTTLLVLSFSAMTIMALVNIQNLLTYRTEQTVHSQENFQYAMGVEDWAKGRLYTYLKKTNEETKKTFIFPQILPLTTIPYGIITGELYDAEGGFNLNSLRQAESDKNFVAGLTTLYPEINKENAAELFQVIITRFSQNTGSTQPQFFSSSELRSSNLLPPSVYDEMNRWMVALPSNTELSINTATAEAIVMASAGEIDRDTAQRMIEARNQIGWITDLEQLQKNPIFSDDIMKYIKFGLRPMHYWVVTTIKEGKSVYTLYTLLKITQSEGTIGIQTLWRSYGTR